jgi:hypothetical protein
MEYNIKHVNFIRERKRMKSKMLRLVNLCTIVLLVFLFPILSYGHPQYVPKIPNGNILSCTNCMNSTFTGNTPFGISFKNNNHIWDSTLAFIDSDSDGFTNGVELQDPQGSWQEGNPAPGDSTKVTNPGDPSSFPASNPTHTPTPTATITATPDPTPTGTPEATVDIYANGTSFRSGDTIKISVKVDMPYFGIIDMYAALPLGGSFYWYPTWNTTPHATQISVSQWDEAIVTIPLGDVRPVGSYTFYAAIAEHDTVNILGIDSFTIKIE